jgi:hypothetical protein
LEQRTRDLVSNAFFLAFVALFLAAAVAFDIFCAGCAKLGEVFVIALCGSPMLTSARFWRRRWKTRTCAACGLVALALFVAPWHPRKRFVRDLMSVRPGMVAADVERVMGKYIAGPGRKWFPGVPDETPIVSERAPTDGTVIYRWNDHDASYDADWGLVTYSNGRVVEVEFSSD